MKNLLGTNSILVLIIYFFLNPESTFSQIQTGSLVFEGVLRDYIIFLPQNYNGIDKLPIVFNLHGFSADAQWQMNYSLMNDIADTAGFIVVYPNGIDKAWNTGTKTISEPLVNDVGFIFVLIDTLEANYNIDLSRVYCSGFSRGSFMTSRLVNEIGQRFAAVANISGGLRPDIAYYPLRSFPVLISHGTSDDVVPYYGSSTYLPTQTVLDFWIQQNGCQLKADTVLLPNLDTNDGCSVEKISYTNCNQESSILFFKVLGGGHQWPGAVSGLNPYGNLNKDINLSAEIWSFFKDYSNPLVDLAFEKSNEVLRKSLSSTVDTLRVISELYNPKSHQVNVIAKIQGDNSTFQDSFQLYDDGMHNDKNLNDNCFGGMKLLSTLGEDMFKVNIYVDDLTAGISPSSPFLSKFSTAGPISIDSLPFGAVPSSKYGFKPYLKNSGVVKTITNVKLKISSNDSWITNITPEKSYSNIQPGQTVGGTQIFTVSYDTTGFPGYFNLEFEISSDNYVYWVIDTTIVVNPTAVEDEIQRQLTFKLEQNFPNPFNPTTTIGFGIPEKGNVRLSVINILGEEIRVLLNEEKEAAYHSVDFNASDLPSGVYFYQLRAGNFIDTKKMLLLK